MPLTANSRLGPYEIRSRLGAGGMGEVYRAHDSRLNRDVAIKVIRVDRTLHSDDCKRFEREARAAAALSHPNIVGIYDFGVADGQQYIVEELVEGESLSSLLTGKPLSLRKLLDIATQVADGLAAAHAVRLVHRDLKPDNIMLARDGRVKILDFGLARQDKPAKSQSGDSDASLAPAATTLSLGPDYITHLGTVLGTPNYMSPEQALGNETDYRSDQFSFGLILYELATGKRAFAKRSTVETMAAIVGEEAPAMDQGVPPPLRWIIERCLQKERERRYESTRDLYWELRNLRDHFSETSSGTLAPVAAQRKRNRWKFPALCAACALLAGSIVYLLRPSGQNIGNYRYTPFAIDTDRAAWSPDGKAIAYGSKVNGTLQVFLRYLNSPVPIQLTHQKLDTVPFGWSSDRNHLIVGEIQRFSGMYRDYKLYSVATVGSQLEFLMDASCFACDLSRDGKAFATLADTVEISDPIGSPLRPYKPEPFKSSVDGITSFPDLSFSPDGKQILLLLNVGDNPDEAWLLPYPAGGGSPRQISIFSELPAGRGAPSLSWMPDGRNVVISIGADQPLPRHLWMTSTSSSKLRALTAGTSDEWNPKVSPDGRSMLYSLITMRTDVTLVSLEDGATKTFITSGHHEINATWSANKTMLAWTTNRNGPFEIWIRMPDGSDRPAVTAADFPNVTETFFFDPSISPDGERIIYEGPGKRGARLWISSANGGAPVQLTNASDDYEFGGSWSPDANQFVYLQQTASGAMNLMTVKTSGNATPSMLKKNDEGGYPDWSPTGEWITYYDKNGWGLISPDGKTSKSLGKINSPYLVFSKNGKLLYGIDTGERAGFPTRATLFSLDPSTLKQKVIRELGKDLAPESSTHDAIRFSLTPDGKSFVYPTSYFREDLWILTGYRQPGWRARISDLLHLK